MQGENRVDYHFNMFCISWGTNSEVVKPFVIEFVMSMQA